MSSLQKRVGEIVDEILEAFLLSDPVHSESAELDAIFGRRPHENLWGCDFHLVDGLAGDLEPGSRYFLMHEDNEAPAVWPIDYACVVVGREGRAIPPGDILFSRVATCAPADLRGSCRIVPAKSVILFEGRIKEQKREAWSQIYGQVGGRWTWLDTLPTGGRTTNLRSDVCMVAPYKTREEIAFGADTVGLSLSAALTERYSWHVALSYSDTGPRVVIPTNPRGCLDLFRARERDPGLNRRAALKHWVNTHYRQRSEDEGVLDYVREHLRGHLQFVWNGLFCELMVSEYDLEKNEFFKTQAEEWRSQRKHNRIRIRRKA